MTRCHQKKEVFDLWIHLNSQVPTLLQAEMAQQGKHKRVGAREGFAYHSVKLVLLINGNRYYIDSDTFCFLIRLSGKFHHPFNVLFYPNSGLFS